jgi:hypothetical protein
VSIRLGDERAGQWNDVADISVTGQEQADMNLSILLGSGASIPAGYPCVTQITEQILSETKGGAGGKRSPEVVVAFLRWLRTVADARYCREVERTTNYEDIYFLASQIRDDLRGEFDNPAVRPLVGKAIVEFLLGQSDWLRDLKNLLERLLEERSNPGRDCLPQIESPLEDLASDATDHIRRQVKALLNVRPTRLDHLDFVADAIQDADVAKTALMTLNHDTLLETCLRARDIGFSDGFSKEPKNDVRIRKWEPALFSAHDTLIPLLKLHGGIDWYRFEPDGADPWTEEYAGIPMSDFSSGQKDENLRRHRTVDDQPMFLIGTFNKLTSYTDPVYLEIYYRAFCALERSNALLVVGYGFGDKGINKLVTEWICRPQSCLLVVVDKYADTLWESARRSISLKSDFLLRVKRLVLLKRDLEKQKVTWGEIADAFKSGLKSQPIGT